MPQPPSRPIVPLPSGIRIVEETIGYTREGDYRMALKSEFRLVITRSWFSLDLILLALVCLVLDSFLVWYYGFSRAPGTAGLLAILFPLVPVAIGLSLTYQTIAGLLNKSWIIVTPETLTIRHGPAPWVGNCQLPTSEIEQLFCEEVVTRGRRRGSSSYTLSALLRDGRKVPLLESLPAWNQGLFIEQRVEACLGIEDARVGGEHMH